MRIDWARHFPPGLGYKTEMQSAGLGLLLAFLFSLAFPIRFSREYHQLFQMVAGMRVLSEQARMTDFTQLLSGTLTPCLVFALCALALAPYHYYSHYQQSKSIYLMRRLPARFELHRRCLTAPLVIAGCFMLLAVLLTLLYFAIYMLLTPRACLPSGQWPIRWFS